jgi:hypothetical protein
MRAAPPPPMSFPRRVAGVILAPGETLRSVAALPVWLDVLVLQTVVVALAFFLFLSSDVGKLAYVDASVSAIEGFGGTVSDAMYDGIRRQAEFAAYLQAASVVLFGPLVTVVIAGVLLGVFSVAGGEATFRQVLAVVAHAGVVLMLQPLLAMPLNYQRGTMSSATSLALFAPGLDEGSFLGGLLGFVDIFYIWYAIVLAFGLAVVYGRRPMPIAVGLLAVLFVVAALVATLKVALGGR